MRLIIISTAASFRPAPFGAKRVSGQLSAEKGISLQAAGVDARWAHTDAARATVAHALRRRASRTFVRPRLPRRHETMSFAARAGATAVGGFGVKSCCSGAEGAHAGFRTSARATPAPRRVGAKGRRALVVANDASQDAYNKAMAEYSKTPFEYRHELGLCACHRPRVSAPEPPPPDILADPARAGTARARPTPARAAARFAACASAAPPPRVARALVASAAAAAPAAPHPPPPLPSPLT